MTFVFGDFFFKSLYGVCHIFSNTKGSLKKAKNKQRNVNIEVVKQGKTEAMKQCLAETKFLFYFMPALESEVKHSKQSNRVAGVV